MKNLNYSSKTQRIIGFLIDRIIIFSLCFLAFKYSFFADYFHSYTTALSELKVVEALKWTIILPLLGYGYLLVFYFLYFVLFHLLFNKTIGKWIVGTELIVEGSRKATFKDLMKRFFYLYISGVGGLGYLYIFDKEKKSKYDDIIKMYVITKK